MFQETLPDLYQHFKDNEIPDLLWINKWFQSCFLYSFPLGLCLRIWDNILAHGTKFLFQMSLAVLMLIEDKMYRLGLSEINDYFKLFKEEVDDDNPIKNFEKLI